MRIYVRNRDGFVLNNYQFNKSMPQRGINNDTMYSAEDYTVYDIDDPRDPEKEWFYKYYYYRNGILELKYVPEMYQMNTEIARLKAELSQSDYKIIKSYEASLLDIGQEYDLNEVHAARQAIRDKINELENYIK